MSQVNAPAVIIAPQHQSAPRNLMPCVPAPDHFAAAGNMTHRGDDAYDREMDCPEYHDPLVNAEIEEMKRRDPVKSSNAMVEEALRQHEMNAAKVARYQWDGQDRWQGRENEEMRLVRIMHPHTFMQRLRQAGIDARLEESKHAHVWLNPWSRLGRVGVNAWMPDEASGRRTAQTVTTLQYPYGPEFSIMRFDDYNVPTNEKYRGWRTALLALIVANVLTEQQAERAFGPALGPAGEFYRQQLYEHRRIVWGLETA